MPTMSMTAFGGKADIPHPPQEVGGFLPGRSYDSMPSKEVLMAETSVEWTDATWNPVVRDTQGEGVCGQRRENRTLVAAPPRNGA